MEHYQPHPAENPLLHPIDHRIRDLLVGDVSPPHEHVGTVEQFLRQALRGVIESGAFNCKITIGKTGGKLQPYTPSSLTEPGPFSETLEKLLKT